MKNILSTVALRRLTVALPRLVVTAITLAVALDAGAEAAPRPDAPAEEGHRALLLPVQGRTDSARRARLGDFDAGGTIACAQEQGQQMRTCAVGVARDADGTATAVVTFANGFSRMLFFEGGAFVKASATMSGSGTDTDWHVEDDLHLIRVDDQRYELPGSLLVGGP